MHRSPAPVRPLLAVLLAALGLLVAATGLLAISPAPAEARERSGPLVPPRGAETRNGQTGRHMLSAIPWYHRADPEEVGLSEGWHRQLRRGPEWQRVRVPHTYNEDFTTRSMLGSVGWYRTDFFLPNTRADLSWILRFDTINHRSQVFLNGRRIGRTTKPYVPFEMDLRGHNRAGRNVLVIRVDNRRARTDVPPGGERPPRRQRDSDDPDEQLDALAIGGWWNYGGILREVYLRRADRIDVHQVRVRSELRSRRVARVEVHATLRNTTRRARRVRLQGRFGNRRFRFREVVIPGRRARGVSRTITVRNPRLWSPRSPSLYPVSLRAGDTPSRRENARFRQAGGYDLRYGIRRISISRGGILHLNGRPLRLRGVSFHEDHPIVGQALTPRARRQIVREVQRTGSTIVRSHYPFHSHFHEMFDRLGIMVWSEIPFYALRSSHVADPRIRENAKDVLRRNILENRNNPSILTWSIFNELTQPPGPSQARYIFHQRHVANQLDPTRPISAALQGYPPIPYQSRYRLLDIIGINSYFGWYHGPENSIADREAFGPYLDRMRRDYGRRGQALMVTEFGAEANREGPVDEKGTYAFQQDWMNYKLDRLDERPWLAAGLYWTLQEFRIRPGWDGGNPKPGPDTAMHQKGLISFYGDFRKPAWEDLVRRYRAWNHTP